MLKIIQKYTSLNCGRNILKCSSWNTRKCIIFQRNIYCKYFLNFTDRKINFCQNLNYLNYRCNSTEETTSNEIEEELDENVELVETDCVSNFNLKNILYGQSNDEFIQKLNNNDNLVQTLNLISEQHDVITKEQAIQSILVLWELINESKCSAKCDELNGKYEFIGLLEKIKKFAPDMTTEELTVSFLYLNKLQVPMYHQTMVELLNACLEKIRNDDEKTSLAALSRFTVTANASKDLYTFFVCKDALPRILDYLNNVNTSEELRLITICFSNLHQLITKDMLQLYKQKVEELYQNGQLNENTVKCLLKVLQFLNYPHWSQKNTILIRHLILLLKNQIQTFQANELETIFKIFQSQFEPAEIISTMIKRAKELLEYTKSVELLACSVIYSLPDERLKMTEKAKKILYTDNLMDETTVPKVFRILRLLKISNIKLCDKYWTSVSNLIRNNPMEQEIYILIRHFQRYMNFNNNLAGTYRNYEFEKLVTNYLMDDLRNGTSSMIPSKFAKIASFILAYGQVINGQSSFPLDIIKKIEDMQQQFTVLDCLHMSRGLQIALDLRYKYYISPKIALQLHRLENVMSACAERHLEQNDLTMEQLNNIHRAYNSRKNSKQTQLFKKILDKYQTIPIEISSRAIKETTYNLNASSTVVPILCDSMVNYIIENKQFILGETVEKVLTCIYNLGYYPQNQDIFQCANEIVHRNFNYMNGLTIVQACLALAFYRAIDEKLINRVFNIEFIKRLENEIELCYSKETYPGRVFNQVMQLNRAICLDYPEAEIPWFQQNYIEAQLSKVPIIRDQFHLDIQNMLMTFAADEMYVKIDEVTPYGYRIDFVIHLDKNRKIIPPPSSKTSILSSEKTNLFLSHIDKVAILLLKQNAFCLNDQNQLKGREHFRHRHLELMGYKVIQIKYSDWYSMYMNMPGARIDYLKGLLQIT